MSQSTATTPSASATVSTTKPSTAPTTRVDALPSWNVLLHNDTVNDMGFVVESLCRFDRLSLPTATRFTMEAHKKGLSLVIATHREHAELIAEQLTSLRLTVTIERAA